MDFTPSQFAVNSIFPSWTEEDARIFAESVRDYWQRREEGIREYNAQMQTAMDYARAQQVPHGPV